MISRRDFLKTGSAAAAGAALASVPVLAQDNKKPLVAVAKGKPEELVKKAVDALGGMKKFVKLGDRVVLKANMGFPNPPEWGTTTHPEIVKATAQLCLDAGAQRVIVIDHPLRDGKVCKEKSGIGAAVESLKGVVVALLEDQKFYQDTPIPNGKQLKTTAIAKEVLRANCLINVPTAKSHDATGVSLGIKNLMGLVWDRQFMHEQVELNQAIADLLLVIKPTLTIVNAVYALVTNGPSGPGKTDELNTVVASADPVAADSYTVGIARWYNKEFKGNQVKHIKNAYAMGLGEIDVEKMDVKIV
ncbi:MAG TPA: DUF362 domain-containing protein [Chitinivibrionales bacterium]|nr:DUF362 domain-containing protein [Chitinivibrionales bacterium]